MADSYRERIMQTLKKRFEASDEWSVVLRRPIRQQDNGKNDVLSLLDTTETKVELLEQYEPRLQVVLEWESRCPSNVEPATHNNRVLQKVQVAMMDPDYVVALSGGEQLALSVVERGSDLDPDTYAGTNVRVGGTAFFDILYRHSRRDPSSYL